MNTEPEEMLPASDDGEEGKEAAPRRPVWPPPMEQKVPSVERK